MIQSFAGARRKISRDAPRSEAEAASRTLVQRSELSCAAAHGGLAVEGRWYPGSRRHGAGWTRLRGDERSLHSCWHRSLSKGRRSFAKDLKTPVAEV
jgi:hypothetical protein